MGEISVRKLYDKSHLPPPLPRLPAHVSAEPLPPERLIAKEVPPTHMIGIVDLTELERCLLGMKLSGMMPKYTVTDYYSALITHIVVKSGIPLNLQDELIDRVVADSGCGMDPTALIELHLRRMLPAPKKTREPEPVAIEAQGPVDDSLHKLSKLPSGPDKITKINQLLEADYMTIPGISPYAIMYEPSTNQFHKIMLDSRSGHEEKTTLDEIRDLKDFLYELAIFNPLLASYLEGNPLLNDRNPYNLPPGKIHISKGSRLTVAYEDFKLIYHPSSKILSRRPYEKRLPPDPYDVVPSRAEIRKMKADMHAESLFKPDTAEYLARHPELKPDPKQY